MRTSDPQRERKILEAATQLFARRNYHEVRMEDIALQAKVAKGTLYRYFQDKEDLYIALIVQGMQRLFEESQQKIVGPGDPRQKLRDFITHIVRFYEKNPYFIELLQRFESSGSPTFFKALSVIRTQFFHLVTNLISQIPANETARSHPEWAALALLGSIRGLVRFLPQPWPAHLSDWIYQQFMFGLAAPAVEDKRRPSREPVFTI